MKNNPSREQLAKSQSRRVSALMVRTLQKFEDTFPDLDRTREGRTYKGDIKAMFNDVMRAARDELNDYVLDYRPLHLTENNTLAISRTFLETTQVIEFTFTDSGVPSVTFQAHMDKLPILEAMRAEFGAGVVCIVGEDRGLLQIVGIEACVDSVLPRMDKFRLHSDVRQRYVEWRSQVVDRYTS